MSEDNLDTPSSNTSSMKVPAMNSDIAKGNWKQLSGKIKEKWGKLTDDELQRSEGHREFLLGRLQEHYGLAKDKAEQSLRDIGFA